MLIKTIRSGALSTAASSQVILSGGLTSASVYWLVGAAFGTGASTLFQGNVLALGTFTLGASGRYIG